MTLASEALFDGEPCAAAVAYYEHLRQRRIERDMARAPMHTREDHIQFDLVDWLCAYARAARFGKRCEARMQPLDGEGSRIAHEHLSQMYWQGLATRDEVAAGKAEIDRAARSYWIKGKVAYVPSRGKSGRIVRELLDRDGPDCWLCGKPTTEADRTIEHLTARSLGGTDDLDNLALAHRACNNALGNLPLAEKEAMRTARVDAAETAAREAVEDYRRIGR